MANKYIAFISYRHAELDSAIAKTLHSLIEQYRIPKGLRKDGENRLGVVFRDEEELHAASDLSSEIQNALNSTEYLIVICSKNSVKSPWVTREVDHFLQNHDRSQVFTVLASGEPMEVFPPQLTRTPEGDLIEPLAVDIRADTVATSRKKLRRELPRLISAILRCPYDALVMREQRRKTRRVTAIAAGAMAVLLGFTSMVLLKNQQIALANDQLEVKNTQLNEANTALEEQKAAVQLRESQLLVQSALEDLDNADYYSAMQKAVDALPADEKDSRPYYSPAEQVLMEALGVFRTGDADPVLNTTVLEQVTDITDFVITEDGNRVLTTDEFGTVFCYDAETGTQLWCQYAPQESAGYSASVPHLFLCSGDQTVIRSLKKTLNAYNTETGKLLWTLQTDPIAKDYLFYHKERDVLLFAASRSTEAFVVAYQLVEVDAVSGQILQTIPFFTGSTAYVGTFSDVYSDTLSEAGTFCREGQGFCGAFIDDRQYLQCFDADLTEGTCRIVYTSEAPLSTGAEVVSVFPDTDNTMYLVCENAKDDFLLCAMRLDVSTGTLLWQQDIPYSDTMALRFSEHSFVEYLKAGVLIASSNSLFLLDSQDGSLLTTKTVSGTITSLDYLGANALYFSFSLADGTCAIGWVRNNDHTIVLTTDQTWQVFTRLTYHTDLRYWGQGIVQMYTDDTQFSLSVSNEVSPGSILLIPSQQKNTLQIVRPTQAPIFNTFTAIPMPEEEYSLLSDRIVTPVGSRLVVNNCYNRSVSSNYTNLVLDPGTGQIVQVLDGNPQFRLPDTLQPVSCSNYEGIALQNGDGTQTLLYDPEEDQNALALEDDWFSTFTVFRCACAYSADGNTLYSAACNPRLLRLWKNAEPSAQTELPNFLCSDPRTSQQHERLLKIGANGAVLVSLHDYQDMICLKNIGVYMPDLDQWTTFQSNACFSDGNSVAFAREKNLMALVDQNGTLQLLDLITGDTAGSFSTQLPAGSVLQLQFFLEDTHLAIKSAGGHLLIYDLSTGTLVYRDQLSDAYSVTLQVFEDPVNGRLYLHCGSGCGLCLDLNSWTVLAKPDNLLYFDSSTSQIYLSNQSYQSTMIYTDKVPGTMELVSMAKARLAEQTP